MALSEEIRASESDKKYVMNLWETFKDNYDYVGNCRSIIHYPDKDFREQGIPNPWQTIAWRRIIRELGEEGFCNLPFELNYLGNENVLFERQFTKYFGNHPEPKELEVNFVCGYFWRYNPGRRDKMLNFVRKFLLEKGTKVEIWTQDNTLKGAFRKMLGKSSARSNMEIHVVKERIDVHYTLIKDYKTLSASRLMIELPHTEAHVMRLETYLTFEELKEQFKCDPNDFVNILRSYIKRGFINNWWYARRNMALNTEQNKSEG